MEDEQRIGCLLEAQVEICGNDKDKGACFLTLRGLNIKENRECKFNLGGWGLFTLSMVAQGDDGYLRGQLHGRSFAQDNCDGDKMWHRLILSIITLYMNKYIPSIPLHCASHFNTCRERETSSFAMKRRPPVTHDTSWPFGFYQKTRLR